MSQPTTYFILIKVWACGFSFLVEFSGVVEKRTTANALSYLECRSKNYPSPPYNNTNVFIAPFCAFLGRTTVSVVGVPPHCLGGTDLVKHAMEHAKKAMIPSAPLLTGNVYLGQEW